MFGEVQLLKESSCQEWEKTPNVKTVATLSWLSPACEATDGSPTLLLVTGCRHELWATTSYKWKQLYQKGFNHPRKDEQADRQVRQTSLQLTWKSQAYPPSTHPPAKPPSNRAGRKRNRFTHYPKDPNIAKYADARKL